MTLILSLLGKLWPFIAGGAIAAVGLIVGWAKTKSAATKSAQADAAVAGAKQQVADAANAEAQANAAAQQAGSKAAAARSEIDNSVATKPADEVRNDLAKWTRS